MFLARTPPISFWGPSEGLGGMWQYGWLGTAQNIWSCSHAPSPRPVAKALVKTPDDEVVGIYAPSCDVTDANAGSDVFILPSSLADFHGSNPQSNYAAADAFLHIFARYYYGQGEQCVSQVLGIVESVDYVAGCVDVVKPTIMRYMDHKAHPRTFPYIHGTKDINYTEGAGSRFAVDRESVSDETWCWAARQWQVLFGREMENREPFCGASCRLQALQVLDRRTLEELRDRG
ncbi:hypothetical protein DL766_009419 [Monosporascus sp. MC13-8B]|uniref:Ketoreductase (KR) domain-containing protein n=1 Tax=Monosporascus cannonballus TaxID=155416 RepID=A0ABY0GSM8_9PEZI|nr:hypothetical protein DL763_010255 [Monosporascus cannonballus]RYO76808.1 hypothetical protein DL762_009690 [Monosporascus cannonballus]RYP15409.1 hypothetical protein DL766_009419 [Monosporascus sp. MC13-8B]